MRRLRVRLISECLATFCLVFAGTGAIVVDQASGGKVGGLGVSLVFGIVVTAMILTLGRVSGAHMNPAVTVGFWSAGRHRGGEVLPYAAAQLAGAVAASLALRALFADSTTTLGVTLPSGPAAQSFFLEFVMSFILMFVIMGVATGDAAKGEMAAIAIGAVVALEAAFGGPVSGASMNPARSFGPALVSWNFGHHWLYWVAPVLGCLLGVRAHRALD